jgi:DNA-binding transcriptional regulator GbsR (MarR family)
MGSPWGVNRTVARIHAYLYVAGRPVAADELVEALGVARSNVSTSLRELQGWRIIRHVHVEGDRREHYESLEDVWEMFRRVLEERKRREVDPTIDALRACLREADAAGESGAVWRARIAGMLEFFETADTAWRNMSGLPLKALRKMLAFRRGVGRLVGRKPKA